MLSTIIICHKLNDGLINTLRSVNDLKPQILIDIEIKKKKPLGLRKSTLVNQAFYKWVLLLDDDEVVSKQLIYELKEVVRKDETTNNGYLIKYQNYAFGAPLNYGGERYAKVRFFRKDFGSVTPEIVHEEVSVNGKIGKLGGLIHHYSYVSLPQVLKKFTRYAWQMAGEKKKAHETVTLKKLFMYGSHMVWARAVKDEGWRDGWRGIVIALCFGYMESLTYWLLLWRNIAG